MAGIDSLLKLAHQQGANELRIAAGQAPKMFARGEPKRLSVPPISEQTLRTLLGGILTAELERRWTERGSVEIEYTAQGLASYRVTFIPHPGGFEVVFLELGTQGTASAHGAAKPEPAASTPPEPVARTSELEPVAAPRPLREPEPAVSDPPPRAAAHSGRLSEWVRRATALRASDLHLAEGECPCMRVDGVLEQLDNASLDDLAEVLSLESAHLARLRRGEALDLAIDVAASGRLRAHVYSTEAGLVAALRLLPRAAPTFAALHMPCSFEDVVELPHGLVLVCGAAGSGKSTTLAALAQAALRRRSIVMVTLEDPIEYGLVASATSLVRRRQVGRDVRDFASGLRDVLRADPDVLVLGELRDRESIALALTAAETGHLILASMHSRSAASAVERIVDSFPGEQQQQVRLQLAESLRAVVAQRLLRKRHGEGRLPAIELLRVNRAVASLIREGKTAQIASVLQSGRREGMLALERCLADRLHSGEIHHDDAVAAANDVETLSQFMTRSG